MIEGFNLNSLRLHRFLILRSQLQQVFHHAFAVFESM